LLFERTRITASIRIVHGSRFHLVTCAEIPRVTHIDCAQKSAGVERG
jgi:hypothetical protein